MYFIANPRLFLQGIQNDNIRHERTSLKSKNFA